MYFPYFRGRQYELLALKELATKRLITKSVRPVIEPVKNIPALVSSLTAFKSSNLSIGLILNPNVGDLADERELIDELLNRADLNPAIIPSLLMNRCTEEVLQSLSVNGVSKSNLLTVWENRDYFKTYNDLFQSDPPKYTLCPDERHIRRASYNKILFENKFIKQSRNADYPEDEFFSDDHIYYKENEEYLGFGDYSIVGNEYVESGFAPYAVAIHIVYFSEDKSLRIRHFISDSNEDISDVAMKFHEAVTKLYKWYNNNQTTQLTYGLQILLDHYSKGTYPGLPTLKKLSIMHHLELMGKYLDGSIFQ